jgi:hypothetical protein
LISYKTRTSTIFIAVWWRKLIWERHGGGFYKEMVEVGCAKVNERRTPVHNTEKLGGLRDFQSCKNELACQRLWIGTNELELKFATWRLNVGRDGWLVDLLKPHVAVAQIKESHFTEREWLRLFESVFY